jgi:hypothetical protein
VLAGEDGRLVVRCYSQGGDEYEDYDFTGLKAPDGLRDALVSGFVARTAPGAGLTSVDSFTHVYRALIHLDRYLAGLRWPPREAAHLTPEHFDGFFESRRHIGSAPNELAEVKRLLLKVEGVGEGLAARLAKPMPKRPKWEGKSSYSQDELRRIAEAARGDLRAAAKRIRGNRAQLERFRAGEATAEEAGGRRFELLDFVDRAADIPRVRTRTSGRRAGLEDPQPWVRRFGTVGEIASWLHLTVPELAAGAVLLGVMTGENPEVIIKTPAAHHRADGHSGAAGTAILDLCKLRRGWRAYMNLALTDVPDWISIPSSPDEISSRDELHTPFGLYVLLHELTARSRALAGGNRLLTGYCVTGGRGAGRGLRPLAVRGEAVGALGRSWGLVADDPGEDGNPVPLTLRLDLLRLTFIELHQQPVAHRESTAASYMRRNRGNLAEYRQVVAQTLVDETAKARARGAVKVMTAEQIGRAATDLDAVAAEHGVDPLTLKRMIGGELDTVLAACTDDTAGRFNPGQPCRASFMQCLDCECARALPRHLPVQVLVHDRLAERREQMDPLRWAERFAAPHAQLADLIGQHDQAAVVDARDVATEADRAVVERFLNRELDLR